MNQEIEIVEIEQEGFVIDSDQKAEWALRKISEHRADAQRMADVCNAEIKRYTQVKTEAEDKCRRDCTFLESLLRVYFDTVPHKATKTQESYKLPSGVLKSKAQQPEYIRDDAVLIEWVKAQGLHDLLKVEPSLKWGDMKDKLMFNGETAVYTATGEIVPGVKIVEREPVFKVEV